MAIEITNKDIAFFLGGLLLGWILFTESGRAITSAIGEYSARKIKLAAERLTSL